MKLVRPASAADFDLARESSRDWRRYFELPLSALGQRYYAAVDAAASVGHSFAIEHQGRALCMVFCMSGPARRLDCSGFPIEIQLRPNLAAHDARRAIREALGEIVRLLRDEDIAAAELRTAAISDPDGMVASALLSAGATPRLEFRAEADLAPGDDDLAADLRHGHRQQVRWGRTHLRLVHVDAGDPDRQGFDRIRALHAEVAGRVTRPSESWQAMLEFIVQGQGAAILGLLGEELVAANIVLDAGHTAYYASGVYRREHFDKPLAHHCLFAAILRARQRGRRFFDLGAVALPGEGACAKLQSIGYFKRGFTSRVVSSTCWRLEPRGRA